MMRNLIASIVIFVISGAEAAGESAVRVTKSDCIRLVEHHPSADVAYQPGVDVRGRKVAPADVEIAPALEKLIPEILEFSIALNPLKGGAARFGETSLSVGTISFDMKTKRAMFNGERLTRQDTRLLSRKCKEVMHKSK
jgi:hypothetical protein